MIAAISRALRLSDDERAYLYHLVGELPALPRGPVREVRPGVLHLLDRLDDTPALVCDATYDVLAWNAMAAALIGDFSTLPLSERNVIWRFFTNPDVRGRHDAEGAHRFAGESVADLRAAAARYPDATGVRNLIDRLLTASAEFRSLWAEQDVQVRRPTNVCTILSLVGSTSTARRRTTPSEISGSCSTRGARDLVS